MGLGSNVMAWAGTRVEAKLGQSATAELTSSFLSPGDPSVPCVLRQQPLCLLLACYSPPAKSSRPRLPARLLEATSHLASVSSRRTRRSVQDLELQPEHGGGEGVDVDPSQPGGGGRRPRGPGQVAAAPQFADNLHPQGPDLVPYATLYSSGVAGAFGCRRPHVLRFQFQGLAGHSTHSFVFFLDGSVRVRSRVCWPSCGVIGQLDGR